jgi:hypothetical protein
VDSELAETLYLFVWSLQGGKLQFFSVIADGVGMRTIRTSPPVRIYVNNGN